MAKRKFRIEGGNYGGELVIGEVSNEFVAKAITLDQSDLVDAVLQSDDWTGEDLDENEEHPDPEALPKPTEDYYMWECDDIEHLTVLTQMVALQYTKFQQMVQTILIMTMRFGMARQFTCTVGRAVTSVAIMK